MALVTRRRFVQRTAFAAAALCGRPIEFLGGGRRILGEREQNAVPIDAEAIRKLASQITGHVIALGRQSRIRSAPGADCALRRRVGRHAGS